MQNDFSSLNIPVLSYGLKHARHHLQKFFSVLLSIQTHPIKTAQPSAWLGWGYKRSGQMATWYAQQSHASTLLLEDGFLRSIHRDAPTFSLLIDDLGLYYDATRPSRLETYIQRPLTPAQQTRAQKIRQTWCTSGVSKYNHSRDYCGTLPQPYVLVIDQTYGDASVTYGGATPQTFIDMLKAALEENPTSTVLVKVHPDVLTRKKKGYFALEHLRQIPRIQIIASACHPVRLIQKAQKVYTVTSQIGFEALLWDKPVRCFGMPFYAGWGLTHDALPAPQRRQPVPLEQLIHAALIDYPRYVHPETDQRCSVEDILEHVALYRHNSQRLPHTLYAVGFSRWKKPILKQFLQGSMLHFVRWRRRIPARAHVVIWGNTALDKIPTDAQILRVEDGFLRSVGLGAALVKPLSWVIDQRGLYYDARQPSDLEHLLQHIEFSQTILERARNIRQRIVTSELSKYNLAGGTSWQRPDTTRVVLLVPGQVESDASLRYGSPYIKRNVDLLRTVRQQNPEAYIIYKPHPDVVAGLRAKGEEETTTHQWCDEVLPHANLSHLLKEVDAVHTLTSLLGFEALLHQKPVYCYGHPFYAGWGLTHDIYPLARRTRTLTLDMLVAATLILYPLYISRTGHNYTTPEATLDALLAWRQNDPLNKSLWRYIYQKFRSLCS